MVEMNRISTAKKTKTKSWIKRDGEETRTVTSKVIEGNGMYVFVYGKGSARKSETRHCSEAQAKAYKEQLEKAGY